MPLNSFPHIKPTPMVVPTRDYPWLKKLMKEVDFACASCSSAQGQPVYYTLEEARKDPVSGPPNPRGGIVTEKGMIATRFLVMCPVDRTVPENNPLMPGGFCDLMAIPPDYKRPYRPQGEGGDGVTYDGDDEPSVVAPKKAPGKFASRKLKTTSDLSKATKKLTAAEKRLIQQALKSNKEDVPVNAVAAAKGSKTSKKKP